jgi:methylenetetrahydrofolate--tRNA-(uracil-5-)-methyltransferase
VTGEAHPAGYDYQPSNVIYALFTPLPGRHKKMEKKTRMLARARQALQAWGAQVGVEISDVPERRPVQAETEA